VGGPALLPAAREGIHLWEGRPGFLSTAHTDDDVERVLRVFREVVGEMQEAGFLPEPPFFDKVGTRLAPAAGQPLPRLEIGTRADAPAAEDALVPLTEAQRELWLAAQMGPEASCALNESLSLELRGDLRLPALHHALQAVVDRHEALRTTFAPDGEEQRIAGALTVDLPLVDLSDRAPAERDAMLTDLQAREGREPFDLAGGPLFRPAREAGR
jgi:hypothetical protein